MEIKLKWKIFIRRFNNLTIIYMKYSYFYTYIFIFLSDFEAEIEDLRFGLIDLIGKEFELVSGGFIGFIGLILNILGLNLH